MVRRAVGAAALLIAIAAGALWWHSFGSSVPAARAQAPAPGIPVTAGTVVAADVPVFLHGIGTVQAYNMVAVKSRVDGQIVKVDFKEGQEVKEGDPLFQIDPRPYQAALEQAQAAKQKDEAQLAGAKLDLERYSKLLGTGYQTRQSYDQQTGAGRPGRRRRSRATRRRSTPPSSTSAMPISARRSTDGSARGWSTRAIWSMRPTTPRSSRSPS